MKYIKQKSTNKIVYSENPHSDKAMSNAVIETGIDESDLEVVEENLSVDEWNKKTFDQESWTIKRRAEYPIIGDQLDMLWHAIDDETLDKTSDFYTSLKATKDKYPKT